MQIFKKIIVVMLTAIIAFTVTSLINPAVDAADGKTVEIHFKSDQAKSPTDYSNYRFWIWLDSGAGKVYGVDSYDHFGGIIRLNDVTAAKVGFIAIKGTGTIGSTTFPAGTKDCDADILITVSSLTVTDGVADAYLLTGDTEVYKSSSIPAKFLSAYFETTTSIVFSVFCMDYTIDPTFVVTADNEVVDSELISFKKGESRITVPDANLGLTYKITTTIEERDLSITVNFDGLYDSKGFNDQFYYDGDDLGAKYSKGSTTFKLWAPVSTAVELCLYTKGHTTAVRADGVNAAYDTKAMVKGEKGVWSVTVSGDLDSIYYTYKVTNGATTNEVVDPYAKSTGVNGTRGMVVNFASEATTPDGWNEDVKPEFSGYYTDAIIYELHVRDLTTSDTWTGTAANKGKYLGVAESGTTYSIGDVTVKTGLDHIEELGVTHVQILPCEDFPIVDETKLNNKAYQENGIFNWGYMTNNYNTLEGSYATDPYDGNVRIKEFRTMVQALHAKGIRLNMDVVYNHSAYSSDSNFNQIIPGYYHRMNNGSFSNGSGCGNETASDRSMVQKFIVDSVTHYATEFNVDGYRFDLMSLHDVDTMNAVYDSVAEVDENCMVYGEPWIGGTSTLVASKQATKETMNQMPNVGSFCDTSRDGFKGTGQAFEAGSNGFLYDSSNKNGAKFGISGGTVGSSAYTYVNPNQIVNYLECHDNWTLFDKMGYYYYGDQKVADSNEEFPNISDAVASVSLAPKMQQAGALLLLSQGCAFLDSGIEMMRTKDGDENSYQSADSVNQLDWSRKIKFNEVFETYKTLISIRKNHESLTLETYDKINSTLSFLDTANDDYIAYRMQSSTDSWQDYTVIHNTDSQVKEITLEASTYTVAFSSYIYTNYSINDRLESSTVKVEPGESIILVSKYADGADPNESNNEDDTPSKGGGCNQSIFTPENALGLLGLSFIGVGMFFLIRPGKNNGSI